jgi:hypothetical protein
MACRRNNEAVGTQAARASGVTESSSRSASLAKGDRFNLTTLTELVRQSMTLPKGAQTSPQSKWARLDRMYRLANPGARETDLKRFQTWRRKVVANNVRQFHEAIEQKRKVSLYYPDASSVRKTTVIPLDVRGGLSSDNKHSRYMWGYAEKTKMRIPIPVDKVLKVETTGEAFDPAEAQKVSGKRSLNAFNLKRDWTKAPDEAKQKQAEGNEKKNPKVGPRANLKGVDLGQTCLEGVNLDRADTSGCKLPKATGQPATPAAELSVEVC